MSDYARLYPDQLVAIMSSIIWSRSDSNQPALTAAAAVTMAMSIKAVVDTKRAAGEIT